MDMFRIPKGGKLEFREIVLGHLKKILEITTQEFRGGYVKETPQGNFILREYVPDQRKCYIQSVESLSDVLLPNFDDKTKKVCEEINKDLEELKKDFDKEKDKEKKDVKEFINKKVELARRLFRQLNFLLKEKDYLKGTIYIEGVEDDDFDDDEITDVDKHS